MPRVALLAAALVSLAAARRVPVARLDVQRGPGGLVGWTWASERYRGRWVNEHLHVERSRRVLVEVTTDKPFIEAWRFTDEGVVAKSRARHGPARIELFSLTDGRRLDAVDAFADHLPDWAEPYAENR